MSSPETRNVDESKERVRRQWASVAEGRRRWAEKVAVLTGAATEAILDAAQVREGMQVLDLASGGGEPALALAAAVGTNGHVTATDLAPEVLAIAEENAQKRGLTNITFQQADAEALPFPDRSFDRVTCRFGVMFFLNLGQALREIYRVLKPGGRVAFVAWGAFEQNPLFTNTVGIAMKHLPTPPEAGVFIPFKFGEAGKLAAALQEAEFRQVEEEFRTVPWPWPGPVEELWHYAQEVSACFRPVYDSIPKEKKEQVTGGVLVALRPDFDGRHVNLQALIVVASAVRP